MRKLRKCIACLLTAALAFGSTGFLPAGIRPVFSITANAEEAETGNFSELQTLITQNYGGTLTLDKDYIAQSNESSLDISGTITIDLNGHTINRALKSAREDGYVIRNSGTLTVTDTSDAQNGVITGGYNRRYGGGVYNDGKFTMTGGTISGNKADPGSYNYNTEGCGGGVSNIGGTFSFSGGTISNNTAQFGGGGVYNSGVFIMSGGIISKNRAYHDRVREYRNGGGVYNKGDFIISGGTISENIANEGGGVKLQNGSFIMSDGVISGNRARFGGGVYVVYEDFTMSGGIISNNLAFSNGDGGGVYLDSGANLALSDGKICGNTALGFGGGMYVNGERGYRHSFTMSGGTISGNNAGVDGGGVRFRGTGRSIKIQTGNPIYIIDNTVSENPSNLNTGNLLINVEGIPANGSVIGVTSDTLPSTGSPVALTGNYSGSDCSFFVSDNEDYVIIYDQGSAKLVYLYDLTTASFTAQPQDASGCIGDKVQFSVSVEGEVQSYQWQYYNKSTRTWEITKLTGNKTATLTVPVTAGRNTMQYRCVITDSKNYKILSSAATLSVIPKIITQPQSVSAQLGTKVKLSVEATGANLIYQWQYYNKAEHKWLNTKLSGNQTNTLTVPATAGRDGMMYWCIVKDAKNGIKVYSGAATVRVK